MDKLASSSPNTPPLDGPTKNLLWAELITHEDIIFGEGAPAAALKKLSLDDILGLGLGDRVLQFRAPADADRENAASSQAREFEASNNGSPLIQSELSSTSVHVADEPPKPKRRGRPPGKSNKKREPPIPIPIVESELGPRRSISKTKLTSSQTLPVAQSNASVAGSRPATPIATTPSEDTASPLPPLTPGSTQSLRQTHPSSGAYIRKAKFTTQEVVQREVDDAKIKAGIAGVYINPTVTLASVEPQERKRKKQMTAVFKSDKLKIPQWLIARRGTWHEEYLKRTQSASASRESHFQANTALQRESSSRKRKSVHNDPDFNTLEPAGITGQTTKEITSQPSPQSFISQLPSSPLQNVLSPNIHQKAVQVAAESFLQSNHSSPRTSGQPLIHHSLTSFFMPPQSSYKSPYSSNSTTTISAEQPTQPIAPPSIATAHAAPTYKSPYQSIYPPAISVPKPQSLNITSTSRSSHLNVQSAQQSAGKAAIPISTAPTGAKGTRKRKVSNVGENPPDKRHKSTPVEPVEPIQLPSSHFILTPASTSTSTQDPLLEDILRQQEEKKVKEAQMEQELQDKLTAAEAVEVPEHLVRLAAAYDNSPGNLILSPDQSTFSFLSMEQLPPENPKLVVQVSSMVGNPIVSIIGSKPMELRVKSRDNSNIDITHRFNIGLTGSARKAADIMRAKLVLAKINIRATAVESPQISEDEQDETELAAAKPFLCERCGKRFKNKEGILYHRTRSQTSCNPNFDPSAVRPRAYVRTPKKKKVQIVEPRDEKGGPLEEVGKNTEGNEQQDEQLESSSDSSLDSVIQWAEKASRAKRRSTSSRRRQGDAHQENGEQAPTLVLSNDEDNAESSSPSANEEDESGDDDVYKPIEERSTRSSRKRAMQDRWARVKAVGGNKLLDDASLDVQQSPYNTLMRMRFPITEEEKGRPVMSISRKQQCWDTAATFLPSFETSAWNQRPMRVRKIHRKPMRRRELPEPITFMQSEDGAWSIRPFGHGVKPIYARPSRRADGNPLLEQYLKRIESGFRPILMPTKNRLFLPATPAKRLLEDPSSYTPPSTDRETPRRGQRARGLSVNVEDDEDPDFQVRISKATGKPVRPYRRGYEPVSKGARSRGDDGSNQSLDQIHVLNSLEPKKLDPADGRWSNPGLDSLPSSFGLDFAQTTDGQLAMPGDAEGNRLLREAISSAFLLRDIIVMSTTDNQPDFFSAIDKVAQWEQDRSELLSIGTVRPDYHWLNHTVESLDVAADLQNVTIAWNDDTSFDVTTLPYTTLDDMEDAPLFNIPPASQYKVPRSSLKPASQNARDLRELHKGWKTRRLTALATDLAGLGDSPETIAQEFGAQIALPQSVSRARNADASMTAADDARLIVGVCVLRTLTGGLDQNIDWVLVSTLFSNYSMNFLTKRWTMLFQKKRAVVEKLVEDFQEVFLPAYQDGEIPPLDYDNLVAYDWNWLVDWVMKKVDMTLSTKAIELPDTRERLDRLYNIREQHSDNARQEGYFSLTYPVYKRMELASSVANTFPMIKQPEAKCADDIKLDTPSLIKSWVRAAALTPDEVWDPRIMKKMFQSLNDPLREDKKGNDPVIRKLVDDAAEILKNEKVLMQKSRGRATPDRTYEPTDVFFSGLRKHVTVQQFVDAARFKGFLDQEFSRGVPCVRQDYMANEGTLMCVTHLQAHGRIRLRPVGYPMNKFGLGEGSYETRKIPKEKFRFDMDIYPTDTYVYDADNDVLHQLKRTEPPRGSKLGELPVWYGIGNHLIISLWHRVLVAFAGIIALRAGSHIDALKKIFKPTLEEWEIWRLLEWGMEHGVFERLDEVVGGWTTGEWWWLVVGWCCSGGEA